MASTVTVAAGADALNEYQDIFKPDIIDKIKNQLELESMMTRVRVPGGIYTPPRSNTGEIFQPYQPGFTPKSSITLNDRRIQAQMLKIDFEVTEAQLVAFHQKWRTEWAAIGKDPVEWSFPRYLWEKLLMIQVPHELDNLAYNGSYSAPTPGTAGASANAVDGLKTKIAAAITAGDVTAITTGALSSTTVMEKVRTFCSNLPDEIKYRPGKILMSKTRALQYGENFRNAYGWGVGFENEANRYLVTDYNKQVVGVTSMEGSDRFVLELDGANNLVVVEDELFPSFPEIYWVPKERSISGVATITRAFDFESSDDFYVSDNA